MLNPSINSNIASRWQPSASLTNLRLRAQILQKIRDFFAARKVLEVETPLLCHTSVTDPFIESIPALVHSQSKEIRYYLQTSPEYAMKRLLAAGSGAIYQITKAFRQDESGRLHNPEFTMLEWYRPGFNHHQLMDEMDDLLNFILKTSSAQRKTYAELFLDFLELDPHHTTINELKSCGKQHDLALGSEVDDRDTWLHLLMTHCIEPKLNPNQVYFIYDFPASQAALAKIQPGPPAVASRFEVYFQGIELANGFHELQDAKEQRERFEENLILRNELGLSTLPIDELFLAALEHGFPDCAGVALGIDRLVMLALGARSLAEVISFDFNRA